MPEANTVSGPATGNAGDATDGLDGAMEAAFSAVNMDDNSFHAAAEAVEPQSQEKEPQAENAAQVKPEVGQEPVKGKEQVKPVAAPTTATPPGHWDAARREAFGKLPPEGQQIMLAAIKDLEGQFMRTSKEHVDERKFAAGVRSLITDGHREQLREAGLSEVDGIARLIQLNDFATKDAPGYVRWLVDAAGLDPRHLFPELAGGEPVDPSEVQPQRQPATLPIPPQLLETIRSLEGTVNGFVRERQEGQQRSAGTVIAKFREEKDAAGNLLHPLFEQEKASIIEHLHSPALLRIEDYGERLNRAYELAVYGNAEHRNQLIEAEAAKRAATQRQADEVAKAKRAKPVVTAQPAPASARDKPKSLDDAIRRAGEAIGVPL